MLTVLIYAIKYFIVCLYITFFCFSILEAKTEGTFLPSSGRLSNFIVENLFVSSVVNFSIVV